MTFLIRLLDPLDKYKTKANDVTIPSYDFEVIIVFILFFFVSWTQNALSRDKKLKQRQLKVDFYLSAFKR